MQMGMAEKRATFRWHRVLIGLVMALRVSVAHAQTVDYDLNQANRTIKSVTQGLQRSCPGDVATYNRLSAKLNQAAKHRISSSR